MAHLRQWTRGFCPLDEIELEFQETLERSDRADRSFSEIAKERIAFTP
jgi:hypothetical protein